MSSFFANIILSKKLQSLTVTRGKLHKKILYKKSACKMLVKLPVQKRVKLLEPFGIRKEKATKRKILSTQFGIFLSC
jgi:hypothetical protein